MSVELDRAGTFRGVIIECGLFEADSGAKAINITAAIHEMWDAEAKTWDDWREYDVTAKGAIWIIKKDGNVNTKAVESIVQYAGWNGNLEKASEGIFGDTETPCQFVVNEEKPNDFHDEVQYRIAFINEYDRTPGGNSNVTPERAKALQAQYGAQFRALGGNAQRNAAVPATKPKAPAPAVKSGSTTERLRAAPTAAKKAATPADVTKMNQDFDQAMESQTSDGVPF